MKNFGKVLLGILIVLIIICVGSGVFLWYSRGGKQVRSIVHNSVQMKNSAEKMQKLQAAEKFTPPEDGVIPEKRLKVYIDLCRTIKPEADAYVHWIDLHHGNNGSLEEAVDGVKKTKGLFDLTSSAMERAGMGPKEFSWIRKSIREARGANSQKELDTSAQLLEVLDGCAEYPELSATHRSALESRISHFRKQLGREEQVTQSPNRKLINLYAADLQQWEMDEKTYGIVGGFVEGGGRRRRVVVHNGGESTREEKGNSK